MSLDKSSREIRPFLGPRQHLRKYLNEVIEISVFVTSYFIDEIYTSTFIQSKLIRGTNYLH